jgi:hypothetical protein
LIRPQTALQNLMPDQDEKPEASAAACERCGSFDTMEFAGKILCADCIQLAGCGCAGHGSDED